MGALATTPWVLTSPGTKNVVRGRLVVRPFRCLRLVFAGRRLSTLLPHQQLWADGKPLDGVALLERMVRDCESEAESRELRRELLDMYVGVGRFEDGVRLGDELLRGGDDGVDADVAFQRGVCLERLGKVDAARDDYEKCLVEPSSRVGFEALGSPGGRVGHAEGAGAAVTRGGRVQRCQRQGRQGGCAA